MIRRHLTDLLQQTLDRLVAEGRLPGGLPAVEIADPRDPSHGDFATNFAMVAAKTAGKNPRELAEIVQSALASQTEVFESVDVAGPGFINLRLQPSYLTGWVARLVALDERLASEAASWNTSPQRINVEFVSVNPNGPITIGSGRGAAFGSTLCNVLEAAGNTVHREYYINDGVNSEQMRLFGESVLLSLLEMLKVDISKEERAYKGDYVRKIADELYATGLVPMIIQFLLHKRGWTAKDYSEYRDAHRVMLRHYHEDLQNDGVAQAPSCLVLAALCMAPGEIPPDKRKAFNTYFDHIFVLDAAFVDVGTNVQDSYYYALLVSQCEDPDNPNLLKNFLPWAIYHHLKLMASQVSPSDAKDGPEVLDKFLNKKLPDGAVRYVLEKTISLHQSVFDLPSFLETLVAESPQFSGALADRPNQDATDVIRHVAQIAMIGAQREDLKVFETRFDTWSSEQCLHYDGLVEEELATLTEKHVADTEPIRHKLKLGKGGVLEDVEIEPQTGGEDGDSPPPDPLPSKTMALRGEGESDTLWLRSTKFGDDQDRVLRRQDGRLTYIASDVAYHKDKFNRPPKADKLITVLGPDHHGYIGRLHAVLAALEFDPSHSATDGEPLSEVEAKLYASPAERDACRAALEQARRDLEVVIFQLVRFMKDGKPAPMRKRDGNIYALIDLIDEIGRKVKPEGSEEEQREVGKDVARFFYLMRSHDTTFDFDLDLAERQSDENPVFYVQYAHARICSVIAKAIEAGFEADAAQSARLTHPKELALIKMIADLPNEVARAAADYGVHRLTNYATELARAYHHFYDACRVILPEDPELSRARLALCEATRGALRGVFNLLGISAPERM